MEEKLSDFGIIRRAESAGLVTSMTGLVERLRTPLNKELSMYFRNAVPKYNGLIQEDYVEDVIDSINEYLEQRGVNIQLSLPHNSGTNFYVVPITENLELKVEVTDEYEGNGEYEKYLSADFFIINEMATTADVDVLIEFVQKYLK